MPVEVESYASKNLLKLAGNVKIVSGLASAVLSPVLAPVGAVLGLKNGTDTKNEAETNSAAMTDAVDALKSLRAEMVRKARNEEKLQKLKGSNPDVVFGLLAVFAIFIVLSLFYSRKK